MINDEHLLLNNVLLFEEGHLRRTRHILTVYALCQYIAGMEALPQEAQQIVRAAAILHDIAIKPCKEKYGTATQLQQQREAPALVHRFLKECGYLPSYQDRIEILVLTHHDYSPDLGEDHQILIEADLIAGCYEAESPQSQFSAVLPYFQTAAGLSLLHSYLKK